MNIRSYFLGLINFWPPLLFSGIRVKFSKDYRHAHVKLKLRFWNANFVGTQYGGAMFSMADPFYMLMILKVLGPDYVVWSKADTIRFLAPGRTDVTAEFHLSEEDLDTIRKTIQEHDGMDWIRKVEIKDIHGTVVAEVEKVIKIKRKVKI